MNADPAVYLTIGLVGLAGFGLLFFVALSMWR